LRLTIILTKKHGCEGATRRVGGVAEAGGDRTRDEKRERDFAITRPERMDDTKLKGEMTCNALQTRMGGVDERWGTLESVAARKLRRRKGLRSWEKGKLL